MENIDEIDKETVEEANVIIKGIQEELELAMKSLGRNDYRGAMEHMEKGKSLSNCPMCQKDISIAIADIIHTESVCNLGSEICDDERDTLLEKIMYLKDEFVPLATLKKTSKGALKTELESHKGFNIPTATELFPLLYR